MRCFVHPSHGQIYVSPQDELLDRQKISGSAQGTLQLYTRRSPCSPRIWQPFVLLRISWKWFACSLSEISVQEAYTRDPHLLRFVTKQQGNELALLRQLLPPGTRLHVTEVFQGIHGSCFTLALFSCETDPGLSLTDLLVRAQLLPTCTCQGSTWLWTPAMGWQGARLLTTALAARLWGELLEASYPFESVKANEERRFDLT